MDSDVIVVGGGPGGSAAAISAAQAGLSVVLLEQSDFPRNRPGETLHPGVEPILKQLGVWDAVEAAGFLRHAGHYIEWFQARQFEAFGSDESGDWRGFQAWRADFDGILLNHARMSGVQVLQPCRALRPLIVSHRVTGIETPTGALTAKFIVDATGSARWLERHWLERHSALETNDLTPPLIARYGYMSGACPPRDEAPLIVADAEGWTWTAQVRPNLYQWTRLSLTRSPVPQGWTPSEFAGLNPVGSVKSANVTWRMVQEAAGPGYFIVGDAAATLDPASSHGVLRALMSGIMAAHLIVNSIRLSPQSDLGLEPVLESRDAESNGTTVYREWLKSWVMTDAERLRQLYAQFPTPASSFFRSMNC